MTEVFYTAGVAYGIWLFTLFPVFKFHREANIRNIKVSPAIFSSECYSMLWRWLLIGFLRIGGIAFLMGAPLLIINYLPKLEFGWWYLFIVPFFITVCVIFILLFVAIDENLEKVNPKLDAIRKQLEELGKQPIPLLETTPSNQKGEFNGWRLKYILYKENFFNYIINKTGSFVLILGILIFLGLPIISAILTDDFQALHLIWIQPIGLFVGLLILAVVGVIILICVNVPLILLIIMFEIFGFKCGAAKRLQSIIKLDEDNYIHIIVGVAAYCIYVWHTGDTETLDYILVHYGFK
ncbi:hypothetical protein N8000_09245 [Rhodospirillales bacterium]|nr:hypothetical protein [Rhodospirillales bacterium]